MVSVISFVKTGKIAQWVKEITTKADSWIPWDPHDEGRK